MLIFWNMKILGNIIWLLFGGIFVAVEYFIASIGLFITIIGIPFGLQTVKLGILALWPFGSEIVHKQSPHGCLSYPDEHHLVFYRRNLDFPIAHFWEVLFAQRLSVSLGCNIQISRTGTHSFRTRCKIKPFILQTIC